LCNDLCFNDLVGFDETLVLCERARVVEDGDHDAVPDETSSFPQSNVLFLVQLGETPLLGDNDELTAREFELASTVRFNHVVFGTFGSTARDHDLANLHTGGEALRLAECATHTSLEPISASARKHLVDTEHVVWVDSDSAVEVFLAQCSGKVLVAANTSGLERFGGDLLKLVRDEVDAQWELFNVGELVTELVDTKLWVWHTTVEPRLWVRLVLAVPVASSWPLRCALIPNFLIRMIHLRSIHHLSLY